MNKVLAFVNDYIIPGNALTQKRHFPGNFMWYSCWQFSTIYCLPSIKQWTENMVFLLLCLFSWFFSTKLHFGLCEGQQWYQQDLLWNFAHWSLCHFLATGRRKFVVTSLTNFQLYNLKSVVHFVKFGAHGDSNFSIKLPEVQNTNFTVLSLKNSLFDTIHCMFNSFINVPCCLLTGIILCMSSENLQVFLPSAYDLSLTSGQHAFFLVHTHHQLNPDVFTDMIGRGNQTSEEMISAMEALFILVSDSSSFSKTTVQVKRYANISLF